MKQLRYVLLAVLMLCCIPLTSCQTGMIAADNIKDTLRPVLARHEAILNGSLDPATISAADKISYRRSGYLLLRTLEVALGNPIPPEPPGLVQNPVTPPTPPSQ